MPLLFLNEISCDTDCEPARAERAMTELARAVLAVVKADRAGTVLVGREPITGLQIAKGQSVGKWSGKNREMWRRLLLMQSKWPHRAVYPEGEGFYDIEYRHRGQPADGLGAAHLMDGLGVSLPVEPCWTDDHVLVERERLVEGAGGEDCSETDEVGVRHLSSSVHCETHGAWIRQGVEAVRRGGLDAVTRGAELWEGRAAHFPHLEFLPGVEQQLRGLSPAWVRPAGSRLAELDQAVASWDPGSEPEGPQWHSWVTGEHQQRAREFCLFTDLDGQLRMFDTHARFTPGPGRVYFRVVRANKAVRVAHVGRKLGV
ncbi:hypothetical protein [Streptomyces sp. NPDC058773]|uniref:hypothetical protein n=1 Tax=Streptomyces sp. NPDC058773 TaxID=3346632 RepID=UPI0036B240E1